MQQIDLKLTFMLTEIPQQDRVQRIKVRSDATIADLMAAIYDEFGNGQWRNRGLCLWYDKSGPLAPDFVLGTVQTGTTLYFGTQEQAPNPKLRIVTPDLIAQVKVRPIRSNYKPVFRQRQTDEMYYIDDSPTIIGREGEDRYPIPYKRLPLAVYQRHGIPIDHISRDHLFFVEIEEQFQIALIAENNIAFLDGRRLQYGHLVPLQRKMVITLGASRQFEFEFDLVVR